MSTNLPPFTTCATCISPGRRPALGRLRHHPDSRHALTYPDTRTEDVTDTYFGTEVADPYRWLEDDRSEETGAWVEAQNAVTRGHLDAIPFRNAIRDRYEQIFNYEKVGAPRKIGDRYYISKNDGLQNQSVWYVRDGLDGEDRVFLDPNTLSEDGTVTASLSSASDDDQYVVVMRNAAGSDWQEIRVMDLETGEETGDVLEWVKFSGASWVGDGFYYSRYPAPDGSEFSAENTFHSVYYHKLGTLQSEDELVFRNDDEPNRYHFAYATEDNRYLILNTSTGTDGNSLHIKDLTDPNADWQVVVDGFDTRSSIVDHLDGKLLILTDIGAPKYRLVGADPANPADRDAWVDIIPRASTCSRARARPVARSSVPTSRTPATRSPDTTPTAPTPHEIALAQRNRLHRRLRRQGRRHGALLRVHLVHLPHEHLPLRHGHGREHAVLHPRGRLRPGRIREQAGLLPLQGRHDGPDVHRPQEGPRARRTAPHDAVCLRRIQHLPHPELLHVQHRAARAGRRLRHAQPARRRRIR